MKTETNKKNETGSKELFFEIIRDLGLRLFVYTVLAIVIFITGKFFWWAGVILFVILAVYLLTDFLTYGFALLVAVFAATVYAVAYLKPKSPAQHTKLKNDFPYMFLNNLLLGIFCLFLLILGGALFVFFFHEFIF